MPAPVEAKEFEKGLRESLAELKKLPTEWEIKVAPQSKDKSKDKRIFFQREKDGKKESSYTHPTFGALPKPWILRCSTVGSSKKVALYFNYETGVVTTSDPRMSREGIRDRERSIKNAYTKHPQMIIASALTKPEPGRSLEHYKRAPISRINIRDQYDILKAIDPGDGSLGGMNGGVFVVRMKGQGRLAIEKRFKKTEAELAEKEIKMMHRLKHSSLAFYLNSFILPDRSKLSLYIEFCDGGSLEDIIIKYSRNRMKGIDVTVPEKFIWHAFAGLCDGLAYLRSGRSYMTGDPRLPPLPNWIPILHRDIKPDNVLLRSRDTVSSKKYPYCVLSDFGLAVDELPNGHPNQDIFQKSRTILGTFSFFAPEQCWSPYPDLKDNIQSRKFPPDGTCHTEKSDVWALGASIFNLAECESYNRRGERTMASYAHLVLNRIPKNVDSMAWMHGRASRKEDMIVRKTYTVQLSDAIRISTHPDPKHRPNAMSMVRYLRDQMESPALAGPLNTLVDADMLPAWATKAGHDFQTRKPMDPNQFKN